MQECCVKEDVKTTKDLLDEITNTVHRVNNKSYAVRRVVEYPMPVDAEKGCSKDDPILADRYKEILNVLADIEESLDVLIKELN